LPGVKGDLFIGGSGWEGFGVRSAAGGFIQIREFGTRGIAPGLLARERAVVCGRRRSLPQMRSIGSTRPMPSVAGERAIAITGASIVKAIPNTASATAAFRGNETMFAAGGRLQRWTR
jgi:hypothetical protein